MANLINKNAQRAQQINHGNTAHAFGSAFNGLFGMPPAQQTRMMAQPQQPMMGMLPGLFPMAPQARPVFPFMPMAQPQQIFRGPQQQPRPVFAPHPQMVGRPPVMMQQPQHAPVRMVPPQPQMGMMNPMQMVNQMQPQYRGNNPHMMQGMIPRAGQPQHHKIGR